MKGIHCETKIPSLHKATIADFCDHSRAHFSIGKFAVDQAVFVDAKFLNGFPVGDFFRSQLHYWFSERAPCARL
ncbi:MAG: hypothetical protein DMG49_11235 [Acidobacteria bacterium]|nr:MAG: hypothetical protein DMG49_11235 [Acidobacteriota bacterium]